MNARNLCVGVVVVVSAVLSPAAPGGSLAPPPGPIQPTNRFVLSQTTTPMPISITQPGSYVLTSDLIGSPGNGIEIFVDGVTLDLNGFAVDGAGSVGSGILMSFPLRDVTVRNGTVRGWGANGVDLDTGLPGASGFTVEDVTVQSCGTGLLVVQGTLEGCVAQQNQAGGIVARRSIVKDCAAYENGLAGFGDGITLLEGAKATDCVSMSNVGRGFFIGITSEAEGCSSKLNNSSGFEADGAGTIRGCISSGNSGDGFRLQGAQAIECGSEGNLGYGYTAEFGATVRASKALNNQLSGIFVGDDALIIDNQCTQNQVNGIQTNGTHARVSGNSCQHNTFDNFFLNGSVNSIYSNSASLSLGGVNYNLVTPLNDVAPISSAAAAVSPVANISY